jgi:hypothetical protein
MIGLPKFFTILHVRSVEFFLFGCRLVAFAQINTHAILRTNYNWFLFDRIANMEGDGRYLKRKRVAAVRGEKGT